jgi:hypothetical protein
MDGERGAQGICSLVFNGIQLIAFDVVNHFVNIPGGSLAITLD